MTSWVGSSISSQKGWPAATSCATSDGEGSRTISPASFIQLRMLTSPPDKAASGKGHYPAGIDSRLSLRQGCIDGHLCEGVAVMSGDTNATLVEQVRTRYAEAARA